MDIKARITNARNSETIWKHKKANRRNKKWRKRTKS